MNEEDFETTFENEDANDVELPEFDKQLIKHIQRSPILWDKSLPESSNREKRQATWANISARLDLPELECQGRWRKIRDRYARELRKIRRTRGSRLQPKSVKWHYMPLLHFLLSHVQPRNTSAIDSNNYEDVPNTSENRPLTTVLATQCASPQESCEAEIRSASGSSCATQLWETPVPGPSCSQTENTSHSSHGATKPDIRARRIPLAKKRNKSEMCDDETAAQTFTGLANRFFSSTRKPLHKKKMLTRAEAICAVITARYGDLTTEEQNVFDAEIISLLNNPMRK